MSCAIFLGLKLTAARSGGDPMGGETPFHHGMHYSNAGIVLHYLVRLQPFARSHLHMQRGRFDEVGTVVSVL